MFPSLDIFKIFADGDLLWRGAFENFLAAQARIQKLALSSPGEYLILDQNTGNRVCLMLPDVSAQASSSQGQLYTSHSNGRAHHGGTRFVRRLSRLFCRGIVDSVQ